MSGEAAIDWSKFRPRRLHVVAVAAIFLFSSLGVMVMQFAGTKDYIMPAGSIIGGDYVAFRAAAKAAVAGEAAATYEEKNFEAMLKSEAPPQKRYGLTWQYPPTYYFVLLPLAFLGFGAGYALWSGLSATAFFATMQRSGVAPFYLLLILSAPSTTHAFITGQNGFLTASLFAVAALFPDRRPILAGLAAAALTVKPQLGLLIPIAFAAGGCWRACFIAAIGAALLAGASVLAFGADSWAAFVEGARATSENFSNGRLPLYKMTTAFAALRLAGAPDIVAYSVYFALASAAALFVALAWRGTKEKDLRAAALAAGVFIVAPYGFFYELVILALPAALIAMRAERTGWLRGERAMLFLVYFLPLFLPGDAKRAGLSLGFAITALLAVVVVRRVVHDAPEAFTFASARLRPQSG